MKKQSGIVETDVDYAARYAAHLERIRIASGAAQTKAWGPKKTKRRRAPGQRLACGCLDEATEQRILVREARSRLSCVLFWTRSERHESLRSATWAKSMGARDGMPDLLVLDLPGVAIELKAVCSRHRVSRRQAERFDWLRERGWVVLVAHGAEDALRQLADVVKGRL